MENKRFAMLVAVVLIAILPWVAINIHYGGLDQIPAYDVNFFRLIIEYVLVFAAIILVIVLIDLRYPDTIPQLTGFTKVNEVTVQAPAQQQTKPAEPPKRVKSELSERLKPKKTTSTTIPKPQPKQTTQQEQPQRKKFGLPKMSKKKSKERYSIVDESSETDYEDYESVEEETQEEVKTKEKQTPQEKETQNERQEWANLYKVTRE